MPENGFEVQTDYVEELMQSIQQRLKNRRLRPEWKKKYVVALYHLSRALSQLKSDSGPVCVNEEIFDLLQSVAWNISVTETVGRDISERVPGAYAWAD